MLRACLHEGLIEAGVDEAGRGPLAGSVFAAAVILPPGYENEAINDSKQLSEHKRDELRAVIEREALAWAVASCSAQEIDSLNILRAAIEAMHRALDKLELRPEAVIVDGNKFIPYRGLPCTTIVGGDGKYMAIAAASILAKTYRDAEMKRLDKEFPQYGWARNKGYPTAEHRRAIEKYGPTPYHRMTFRLLPEKQLSLGL